jgi:5-histidylcysteine sulfoxide synthase
MPVSITRNPNLTKIRQISYYQSELKNSFGDKWWTGLSPENCPGFDPERHCLTALPLLNLETCTRSDILDYFNNSWTLTELIFQGLKTEEVFKRPPYHGLRHPLIFYYGHPAVLYLNKLRLAGLCSESINLYFEKILETGVDEMSWDDMSKNEMEWPSVYAVHEYRKNIYTLVCEIIKSHPDLDFVDRDSAKKPLGNSPWWCLWMAIEHEKIHFETSSVLIRELPIELVEAPKYWAPTHPSRADNSFHANSWKKQLGQKITIGKKNSVASFGWDNEYGERDVNIQDFQYTQFQITNREFFNFVISGAYVQDAYWGEEGICWRKFRNTKRPSFWCGIGPEGSHEYELRTIFEIIPMPWNWPVEVNYHEAMAYTNWKNEQDNKTLGTKLHYRLLSEGEFKLIRNEGTEEVLQTNFNFIWSTPGNVTARLSGNCWHWIDDQFNPLPNFKVSPYYDDFSTPCFDGKHQMILGGSFISTGAETSQYARFHFRPHFYQHSGFRMAAVSDGSLNNGAIKLIQVDEYIHTRRKNVLDQMQSSSEWWKNIDQPLEMTEDEMKLIFSETEDEVLKFMKNFNNMNPMGSACDPKINNLKKDFILPYQMTKNFPQEPLNYNTLLKFIFNDLAPLSQLPGHPGFAAYVAGCGNIISNTAQLIAQTLNPFTGHYMMAPGPVALEQEVIKWFIDLVGYNEKSALGYLTSGGSAATLNALIIARLKKLKGYDYSKVTGYMSTEAHHCVAKAWVMLGFKKENLRLIKASHYKIDILELNKVLTEDKSQGLMPFFLVGTLGTTKTGSIDSIDELADFAFKENLWLHADGAYGAFFMLTEKGRKQLVGIDRADSIVLDPHKALSIPYGTGCLLLKNGDDINFDYMGDDSYMPPKSISGERDYADISPELSRDFRGLRVWLPIKTLGIAPFILNLEEKLKLSNWLCEELKKIKEIIIVSEPELTIQTFAHINGDESTRELMIKINTKGTLFLSSCSLDGRLVIRICLLGHRLHYERLQSAVSEIRLMAAEC